jgi:peptidoglycan/LPS O-acetylase OafA/YrhL
LIYFYKRSLEAIAPRFKILIGLAVAASLVATWWVTALQYTIAPFVGSIGMATIIGSIKVADRHTEVEEFFGRASYHLFITHWTTGAFLISYLGWSVARPYTFIVSVAASLALSVGLVRLERLIDVYRRSLKIQQVPARLPIETLARINAVLDAARNERPSDLIREAVEREIARRQQPAENVS